LHLNGRHRSCLAPVHRTYLPSPCLASRSDITVWKYHLEWGVGSINQLGKVLFGLAWVPQPCSSACTRSIPKKGSSEGAAACIHTNYSSNVIFFASFLQRDRQPGKQASQSQSSNLNFEFEFEFGLGRFPDGHAQMCCCAVRCLLFVYPTGIWAAFL
jgi:hypothetical protein